MNLAVTLALLFSLTSVSIPDVADAQPAHPRPFAGNQTPRSARAKVKASRVGGVETIKPQEPPSKDRESGSGWNGAYVGVNAGAGFGATAGTNVVLPFGASGQPER
ncbi:hypothetical protein [Methylocystis sp. ATCC 49242]|uniref:hypothetical protein n=1 Tax=Methylocystis sp. ATCC 49242 TaxID=622637 RepID=UPI0001F8738D|nr:hypothetical protein [Methylocystis sp. ATCC 49242]